MRTTKRTLLGLITLATSFSALSSTTVCINESDFPYSGNNVKAISINTETKDIAVKTQIRGEIYTHDYKLTKASTLTNGGEHVTFYGHNEKSEYVTLVKQPKSSTLMFANIVDKDGTGMLTSVRRFEGLTCH
ncbi:TPA: hypothetical protein NKY36_003964 [Vibrio parahaemolyticus]|uniref:hypothetical protein n=1 Tax=Vibrio parahaemolyticus TaxID=670 RepID=UPI00111E7C06|nr:hypothetical protein [Vibrio parahaemolyticus]MBE3722886.1 hypothetical protein [Vibrio parahaemolyticus]MBE3953588.1 hypothetical protein [Vibrio parahaemolyticus]MBE4199908.1 hypothetical protein [Vibrio parahaemolyticus]MBE4484603.1 hypothetical protein [Vibrio parahaemolyticus]MBE5127333.1 hypothetical protein [Vibrio parahaemolyticus]